MTEEERKELIKQTEKALEIARKRTEAMQAAHEKAMREELNYQFYLVKMLEELKQNNI